MNNDLSILIYGYDGYKACWNTNSELFLRNWSDCPYNVYFSTCNLDFDNGLYKVIKCGENKNFCQRLSYALAEIKTKYVMLLCEDFFLIKKPDSNRINEILEYMNINDVFCTRLSPSPKAKINDIEYKSLKMGLINPDEPYSVNMQAAIWNREKMINLVQKYNTVWEIEFLGSRNYPNGEVTVCLDPEIAFEIYEDIGTEGAIQGGKWVRRMVNYAKKNNIILSDEIKKESLVYYIWKKIKQYILRPFIKVIKKTNLYNKYREKRYAKIIRKY